MSSFLRTIAGFAMLLLGVVGLILPVVPGWILVIPGLMLLSREYEWPKRLLERLKKYSWLKKYYPKKSPEA